MEAELDLWRSTLSAKEIALHKLAAIKLKKELIVPDDKDNGSYYPDTCHAFVKWKREQAVLLLKEKPAPNKKSH